MSGDTHQRRTMKSAWDALLQGDTARRDTLVAGMERARLLDAKERALQTVKAVDFFVNVNGVAIRSRDLLRVAL